MDYKELLNEYYAQWRKKSLQKAREMWDDGKVCGAEIIDDQVCTVTAFLRDFSRFSGIELPSLGTKQN